MTMIECDARVHFCVNVNPTDVPGDFSISISNGPVACLILSEQEKRNEKLIVEQFTLTLKTTDQQSPHHIQS